MKSGRAALALGGLAATLIATGCMVGPKDRKPDVPLTPAFKEPLPDGWKQAAPSDGQIRGKWWEMYNDPQLNALEEQVAICNQNVLVALAQYQEAKAAVRVARAGLFPTATAGPSITHTSSGARSANTGSSAGSGERTIYSFPLDVSWEADIWGRIRRGVNAATAQA